MTVAVTVTVVASPSSSPTVSGLTDSVTPATAASSSVIVPVALPAPAAEEMSALVGLPRVTVTVSFASSSTSPLTGTVMVALDAPAVMVTEPEAVPV